MKKILMFSSNICPYCIAAKDLFGQLNLNFQEKIVDNNIEARAEMLKLSNGRKTVPQIFIGDIHIGGYDDLKKLHNDQKLKSMLDGK